MPYSERDIDNMTHHYAIAAIWTATDEDGDPIDQYTPDNFTIQSYALLREDCAAFAESAGADLDGMAPEQAGHDFWLTRNGHGAGFWDRGLGDLGDRLTALAKPFGECDVNETGDGRLHI